MWLQQRYRAASALAQKDVGLRPLMLCKSDDEFFRRLLHQGTAPSANNKKNHSIFEFCHCQIIIPMECMELLSSGQAYLFLYMTSFATLQD